MPTYAFEVQGGGGSGQGKLVSVEGVRYLEADELTTGSPLLEVVWDHSSEVQFDPPCWLEADVEEQDSYGVWHSVAGYRITELKKAAETGAKSDGSQVAALVELVA